MIPRATVKMQKLPAFGQPLRPARVEVTHKSVGHALSTNTVHHDLHMLAEMQGRVTPRVGSLRVLTTARLFGWDHGTLGPLSVARDARAAPPDGAASL
jgi:hypothetical protein